MCFMTDREMYRSLVIMLNNPSKGRIIDHWWLIQVILSKQNLSHDHILTGFEPTTPQKTEEALYRCATQPLGPTTNFFLNILLRTIS